MGLYTPTITNYGSGGGATKREGEQVKRGGGGQNVLATLKVGHKKF